MIIINCSGLAEIKVRHPNQKIVYVSGAFDLVHAGHILFFEDCKKLGDILVVGVASDSVIQHNKKKDRPILNQHIRIKTIDSLKAVDYVVLNEIPDLNDLKNIFSYLKPTIYAINDDAWNIPLREEVAKISGVELVILERRCPEEFEKISTTGIIEKIRKLS